MLFITFPLPLINLLPALLTVCPPPAYKFWSFSSETTICQKVFLSPKVSLSTSCRFVTEMKQAGAELGQAQLKLGMGFPAINLHEIDELEMLFAILTATNH